MRATLLVAAAFGLLATHVHAADEASVLRLRAEQLAAQDRCDEALPRAERARELAPDDARAALVVGRCALRTGRYADAIEPLEDARRLDPSLDGVATDLAQVHYHLGQLDRAETELEQALARNPDDARALLYRGLVLLGRSENASAGEALDRASRLDSRFGPAASYYAGLAWEYAKDRERAEAALERARDVDPDGQWGREAERALMRLGEPYARHWWARLRGGVEYDTNVSLSIPGSANTLNVLTFGQFDFDEDDDTRGVFDTELGVELLRRPDWSAGVIGGYQGNAHARLHRFDIQYPWLVFWLDHRVDEKTWLRFQPFGGYEWLNTVPFVIHGGGQLSVDRQLTEALTARVFGRYNYNNFLFRIPDDQVLIVLVPNLNADAKRRRDRDGHEVDAGPELEYTLDATETRLRGGSAYEYYDSDGKDWRRNGVRGWVGLEQGLPLEFFLDAFGSFAYRDYKHRSSFSTPSDFSNAFGPRRIDRVWEAQVELERPIVKHLKIGAHYAFESHDSNVRVFDYDRHIVGGYFTLDWAN